MAERDLSLLNAENPWPGLESFGEADAAYFRGRDAEIADVHRLVRRELLTVLFGQSGLGKTSLLGAGLYPLLRKEGFLPVTLRIDFSDDGPSPREQVLSALQAECTARGVEAPPAAGVASLWEYFHREDADFWNEKNRPVTPVLAFDQFEEAFTLGLQSDEARSRSRDFLTELGDLIENRPPRALKEALDSDPERAQRYDFSKTGFKLILSFREDYLAHVEGLKRQIPSLTYNRYRLQPMQGAQAHAVVMLTERRLVDADAAARIIAIAAGSAPGEPPPEADDYPELNIDPALLSVICSELNLRRQAQGQATISAALVAGAGQAILSDFYERCVAGLDPRVRVFVEDELLTDKGYRDSFALDDAVELPGISQVAVDTLVTRRLVRVDDRFGVRRLELTHDVLTRVVRDSRDSRQAREAEAAALVREAAAAQKQRRQRVFAMLLGLGFVVVAAAATYVFNLRGDVSALQVSVDEKTRIAEQRRVAAERAEAQARLAQAAASQAQQAAVEQQQLADAARENEARSKAEADRQQARAQTLRRGNDAAQLLLQASRLQDLNYELSLLLAVEAARLSPSLESRASLVKLFQRHPRLDRVLAAAGALQSVRLSSDGRRLAAASADGTVRQWDPGSGRELPALQHDKAGGAVFDIAFDGAGQRLASAGADTRVVIWDLASGRAQRELAGDGSPVSYLAFSADGATLAVSTQAGRVRLFNAATGAALPALEGELASSPEKFARAIAFAPDGRVLAAANPDNTVTLWELPSRRVLASLSGHSDRVRGIAFSPDGRIVATSGDDRGVRLWNTATGSPRGAALTGHPLPVWALAFGAGGRTLVSAGDDRTVIVWDVEARRPLARLEGHDQRINALAFSTDRQLLASAGGDGRAILWNLAGRTEPPQLLAQPSSLLGMAQKMPSAVWDLAYSRDGTLLAVAGEDGNVGLWDAATWRPLPALQGRHEDRVNAVAFSPDGRTLASGSDDGRLIVWDTAAREPRIAPRAMPLAHSDAIKGMAFSRDGRWLASAGRDRKLVLWNTATWQPARVLPGPPHALWAVAFAPDSRSLAAAYDDGSIQRWDLAGKALGAAVKGHARRAVSLDYSPDGSLLASASADGSVGLWNAAGERVATLLSGKTEELRRVRFDRSGEVLAAVGDAGQVTLWEVSGRKQLVALEGHRDRDRIRAVDFSPDGGRLVTAGDDALAMRWNWDLAALTAQGCRVANRGLSAGEQRQYLAAAGASQGCGGASARR